MRNGIVHAAEEAIPLDAESGQEPQHRINIYLAKHVGLHKMEKEKIVSFFLPAVSNIGVWDRHLTAAFLVIDSRAIASEVKEIPWPRQSGKLPGLEALFQP